MVEFKVKIHPAQRITYFPKQLVEQFGYELKILPNANGAIVFPKDKPLEAVIKSVDLLRQDLILRKEGEETSENE